MTKNEKVFLLSSVLISLILRLYIIFNSKISFYIDDAPIYASLAKFFLEGNWKLAFHPTWPPLYPFLTALAYKIFGSWENATRLVSAIAGSLLIIPLYLIAKIYLSKQLAFLFSILSTLIIFVFRASISPLSDMLFVFLLISAIALTLYGLYQNTLKYLYFASIAFGFSYLARSESFMFFVLTFSFLFFWFFIKLLKKKIKMKELAVFPIAILLFFLVINPYWIATKRQTGSWSLSQKASAQVKQGHSFQLKNGTTWNQEVVSIKNPNYKSSYFKNGIAHVLEYSDWYGFWFIQKLMVWKNLFLSNFPIWTLPLMVNGILVIFKKENFWQTLYLLYIFSLAVPITVFATPLTDPRYLLWVFPLVLLFIFIGTNSLLGKILKNKSPIISLLVILIISLYLPIFKFIVFQPKAYAKDQINQYYREEILEASKWLRENSQNPKIMMKHELVEYYSDGQTIYIPQDISLDEVISYGKKKGAQYIVAWREELFADKNLSILLKKEFKHKHLERVFEYPGENPKIIIYKLIFFQNPKYWF